MAKMRRSGYDERMRKRILVAGVLGYTRMDKNVEEGISRINRPRWVGAVERRKSEEKAAGSKERGEKLEEELGKEEIQRNVEKNKKVTLRLCSLFPTHQVVCWLPCYKKWMRSLEEVLL